MKHVKYRPEIGDWMSSAMDEAADTFRDMVRKTAIDAVNSALQDEDTHIYFPSDFYPDDGIGNVAPIDPMTVYLRVAFANAGEIPTYSFNLREVIKETLFCAKKDGSYAKSLAKISMGFRDLADHIDATIAIHGRARSAPSDAPQPVRRTSEHDPQPDKP